MADLETCIAFIRAFEERRARRVVPFRFGKAMFDDALPRARQLNFLWIRPDADPYPEQLIEDADRLQGGAGLDHRGIFVDDEELGARLEGHFRERGWNVVIDLVMPHVRDEEPADTYLIREVSGEELAPVWAEGIRGDPTVSDEETVRQLVEAQLLRRFVLRVRYFAAFEAGRIASYCELFSDGKTGQIESVMTLPEHRRKGHGRTVVTKALQESRAMGHSLTFLLAHEHDWPKELYRALGFEAAGRIFSFVKPPEP
jgi:ribosomal protein S18 acetylase RimI-like enzyme